MSAETPPQVVGDTVARERRERPQDHGPAPSGGTSGRPEAADERPTAFMEEGIVTLLSSVYLGLTGVIALACGLFYDRLSKYGRAFWVGLGGVFLFLAADERLQFHESAGYALHDRTDSGPFRNWNDVVVMGYGIAAFIVAFVFLSEIVRLPRVGVLFGQAFLFYAIHTTIDSI